MLQLQTDLLLPLYILQVIELLYFSLLGVVFLFAYGVAIQSLLYPNSKDTVTHILYHIFFHPYLSMFQDFESHLDELQGMHCTVRYDVLMINF